MPVARIQVVTSLAVAGVCRASPERSDTAEARGFAGDWADQRLTGGKEVPASTTARQSTLGLDTGSYEVQGRFRRRTSRSAAKLLADGAFGAGM